MDYEKLVYYWNLIHPEMCDMMKEFKKNVKPTKYHDIEILKCIENSDLDRLCERYEAGYSWECYKSLLIDLCVYFKHYQILDYFIHTSQINRDVNESIARLAADDDWKQLVSHQPKDDATLLLYTFSITIWGM